MHRASSSSEEKQEKWHLDLLILSVASPLIPITWYLQTLSLPEINMLCGVWQCLGPVGHRDIVLIGVTLGHFRPMRDQGWSARTNQMPLPTICRSHPRCQSSHGEYCPLLRMPTFGVMFLLDTEMCISNWDWLHLISLRLLLIKDMSVVCRLPSTYVNKINYCFIMDMYSDYYIMEEIYLNNDVISLSNGKTVLLFM